MSTRIRPLLILCVVILMTGVGLQWAHSWERTFWIVGSVGLSALIFAVTAHATQRLRAITQHLLYVYVMGLSVTAVLESLYYRFAGDWETRITSIFGNPNILGASVVIGVTGIIIQKGAYRTTTPVIIVGLMAILASGSRIALLAWCAVIMVGLASRCDYRGAPPS